MSANMTMYASESDQARFHENLEAIRANWNLTPKTTYLAISDELRPHPCPTGWPPRLVEVLRRLSELTVGQKGRAHTLLATYFRARIRSALYKVQQKIFSELEVVDVQDAIRSLELMIKGQAVENVGRANSMGYPLVEAENGKRKFGLREEVSSVVMARPAKMRRVSEDSGFEGVQSDTSAEASLPEDVDYDACLYLKTPTLPDSAMQRMPVLAADADVARRPPPLPSLEVPQPQSLALAIPDLTDFPSRSPISALLNYDPPSCFSPTHLPPIYTLIKDVGRSEALVDAATATPASQVDHADEESYELRLRRLELDEAEATLEVAKQMRAVAMSRAACARLERNNAAAPARPKSSHGWVG